MDKNIIGAAIAVPFLLVSGYFGGNAGAHCTYTKPDLVFAKACQDSQCRKQVARYLPGCQKQLAGQMTKTVRFEGGSKKAAYLSLAVMDDLTSCMSKASFGTFNTASLDFSSFKEVSKDVRGDKMQKVGGGDSGSGLYMLPVVGQTTMLYGPA